MSFNKKNKSDNKPFAVADDKELERKSDVVKGKEPVYTRGLEAADEKSKNKK